MKDVTRQEFKDTNNPNRIMKKYRATGTAPQVFRPTIDDFVMPMDLHGALQKVKRAEQGFMRLPAKVRERFRNNVQSFVSFCADPKTNKKDLQELGLLPPDEPAADGKPDSKAEDKPKA